MAERDSILPKLTPQQAQRFHSNVSQGGGDDCWPWKRFCEKDGYGIWQPTVEAKKRALLAHRVAFFLHAGYISPDKCVCHTCDNPSCCNPAHLFEGTNERNTADRHQKGRDAKGERHGSKTHPEKVPRGKSHGRHTHPERSARGDRNGARLYPERLVRGASAKNSKLTEDDVREIRRLYANGVGGYGKLAERYGVSRRLIGNIVLRKSWAHI